MSTTSGLALSLQWTTVLTSSAKGVKYGTSVPLLTWGLGQGAAGLLGTILQLRLAHSGILHHVRCCHCPVCTMHNLLASTAAIPLHEIQQTVLDILCGRWSDAYVCFLRCSPDSTLLRPPVKCPCKQIVGSNQPIWLIGKACTCLLAIPYHCSAPSSQVSLTLA